MRNWISRVAILCMGLVLVCLHVPSASATTDYDDITVSGGSFVISYHGEPWTSVHCTNDTLDLYDTWMDLILDESKWDVSNPASAIEDFEEALDNGTGWGVTQVYNTDAGLNSFGSSLSAYGGEQDTWLQVWWNDTGTAQFDSASPYGPVLRADGNVHLAFIYFSAASGHQCEPRVTQHVSVTAPHVNSVMAIDNSAYSYFHWAPVFLNFDVTYPSGYEGAIVPVSPPAAEYVAMGDSYSSGEGNFPYEDGSDTMANVCHRSPVAYPRQIQSEMGIGPIAFVACSGAVSDYIINNYNQENVEIPQALYVGSETELVTISIGGNDVGFGGALATCTASNVAQECLDAVATASTKIADPDFQEDIGDVLAGIESLGGGGMQVILVGYPNIFPSYGNISGSCKWGSSELALITNAVSAREVTENEIDAFREAHDDLNQVLEDAVADTMDNNIHFVDPSSLFENHEVCGSLSPWINGVMLHASMAAWQVGSYHPNEEGQEAYAFAVTTKLDSLN